MAFDFDLVSVAPATAGYLELRLAGEGAPRLLVKFAKRGERTVLTRLVLDGDLDSQVLRQVPLGRIEAALNTPHGNLAEASLNQYPDDVVEDMERRGHMFPTLIKAADGALTEYFEQSADEILNSAKVTRKKADRPRLTRPDGTDPDGFSRRVAQAYGEAVAGGSPAPAVDLAGEADVPVTTVHRWIADARRRGYLPPARKGKAG